MKYNLATVENDGRYHHYASVIDAPKFNWKGKISPPFNEESLRDIHGLVISDEWYQPARLAIAACKARGIPTFHILDGIAEWRNLFDNPRSTDVKRGAPLWQPLLSDYTFCLGSIQRWILQWLGNTNVYATGLPRLDSLRATNYSSKPVNEHKRVLVATANTPWFDDRQQAQFMPEFSRLTEQLLDHASDENSNVEYAWRIADIAAREMNYPITKDAYTSAKESLEVSDVLITTPSSLVVEAMLLGVPTLVFDPYACPPFTPTAWFATSANSVLAELPSLLKKDDRRCSLQDSLLPLITPTDSSATKRIREFILSVLSNGVIPNEQMTDERPAPKIIQDRATGECSSNLTLAQMKGMLATIPSLDAQINEKEAHIRWLEKQLNQPTLRQCLGTILRFFRNKISLS